MKKVYEPLPMFMNGRYALCQGGDCCDFRFVRHRKGETWERTKSI